MSKTELTAQQKAQLFSSATRQNYQMLPNVTVTSGATTMQFSLPKSRLLSKIYLRVSAVVNVKHASKTTIAGDEYTPYKVIRKCNLDLNNGFAPFTVSGTDLAIYNSVDRNAKKIYEKSNYRNASETGEYVASPEGTDNAFDYVLELPVTLNPRDPIGMILLQNDQTNVTLNVDIANGVDIFAGTDTTGYEVTIKKVVGEVCLETFSIPANEMAFPDLTVLKLVNGRTDSMPAVGQQIIKLATGTIYRKLVVQILDEDGKAVPETDLTNIELVFNQADVNVSISPAMLRAINTAELGYELPKGVYVFDFSAGGNLPNYGSTRDFIDTDKLTEFWVRFSSNKRGKVNIVTECLSRLQG